MHSLPCIVYFFVYFGKFFPGVGFNEFIRNYTPTTFFSIINNCITIQNAGSATKRSDTSLFNYTTTGKFSFFLRNATHNSDVASHEIV